MALLSTLLTTLLLVNAASATPTLGCPEGYTLVGLKCYLVSPEAHSGALAEQYCHSRNGSTAVVESQEEMELLRGSFLTMTVHIGINLLHRREEIFKIAQNVAGYTGYTSFGRDEPDNYGGEDCVVAEETRGYDWRDVRCDETHPVLCSTQTTIESRNLCREDAYKFDNSTCFWVHDGAATVNGSGAAYTWEEARSECLERGGDLASIHSYEENNFISGLIQSTSWIGLNDIEAEAHYIWTDGTPLDYTDWRTVNNSTEPDDTTSQNCVRIYSDDYGGWNDYMCDERSGVVCKEPTF